MPASSGISNRTAGFITLIAVPLAFFLALRLNTVWDVDIWGLDWNVRLIHYYVVSFATITSLVVAIFVSIASGSNINARTIFITLGFAGIASLLLVRSLSTPGVLNPMETNEPFRWSLRLGLLAGAILFSLANVPWTPTQAARVVSLRRAIAFSGALMFLVFLAISWFQPTLLSALTPLAWLEPLLAITAVALYLLSASRTWQRYRHKQINFDQLFTIALILLAEAQIFNAFGPSGNLSWFLAPITVVLALIVMLFAIMDQFQHANTLRPAHYFAAIGSIVIFGVAIIVGEFGVRWFVESIRRTNLLTMALIQGAISFLVLYFIIYRLDKLIQQRTAELQREQRLRGELTQLIIHDLKNPLTVITSGLNLLTRKQFNSSQETQQRLVHQLENAGGNIINMINDLLDVERLEAGQMRLNRRTVDINKLLAARVNDSRLTAETNRQTLTLSQIDNLPNLRLDNTLLERVIDNLLSNALKFTPEEGKIHVQTLLSATKLTIVVEDSGPGVTEEERERIFEKFGQVQGSERRGAGLGLTFCRMVAQAHDGDLVVTDSTLGGAKFLLHLPLSPPNSNETQASNTAVSANLDSSHLIA